MRLKKRMLMLAISILCSLGLLLLTAIIRPIIMNHGSLELESGKGAPKEQVPSPKEQPTQVTSQNPNTSGNESFRRASESKSLPKPVSLEMEEQLKLAASVFGIDLHGGARGDREMRKGPFYGNVREIKFQDSKTLCFDLETGKLISFLWTQLEDVPQGLTIDNAISEEQASAATNSVIKSLGTGADFELEKTQYKSILSPDTLRGALWVSQGSLKFNGIPYFGSGIAVSVSAYSGKICAYSYLPMGPLPSSLAVKLTADQASDLARDYLADKTSFGNSPRQLGTPRKWIARDNNYWTKSQNEAIIQGENAYVCWIVSADNGPDFPLSVFIDAQTGDIRGGM